MTQWSVVGEERRGECDTVVCCGRGERGEESVTQWSVVGEEKRGEYDTVVCCGKGEERRV